MMDLSTEIRKLSSKDLFNLVQILEIDESWRKLMASIPKTLYLDNYECKITLQNRHKYNSEHFKIIEDAGPKYKKMCSEILLDEWGTSGRIRPRLGHLIALLKKTELYRAADYIAVNLLRMPELERPTTGPAAKVPIPKDEELQSIIQSNYPSSILNGDLPALHRLRTPSPNYPSSLLEEQISTSVLNQITPNYHLIPKIIVNNENYANSNLSTENNINVPAFSDLLDYNPQSEKTKNTFTDNLSNEVIILLETDDSNGNIPNLTILNNRSISNVDSENYLPNLTILNNNSSENIPAFSKIISRTVGLNLNSDLPESNLPNLTIFNQNPLPEDPISSFEVVGPSFTQLLGANPNLDFRDNSNFIQSQGPSFSQLLSNPNSELDSKVEGALGPSFSQHLSHNQSLNPNSKVDIDLGPPFSQLLSKQNSEPDFQGNSEAESAQGPSFSQLLSNTNSELDFQGDCKVEGALAPSFSQLLASSQSSSPNSKIEGVVDPSFSQLLGSSQCLISYPNSRLEPALGPQFTQLLSSKQSSDLNSKIEGIQEPNFNQIFNSGQNLEFDSKSNRDGQKEFKIPELRISDENLGVSDSYVPAFSKILDGDSPNLKIENVSGSATSSGSNSPNLSRFNKSVSSTELRELKGSKNSIKSENFGSNLTVQSITRTCNSPLPNLSLNTILPHFTYIELEKCTNNFDETVVSDQDSNNLNQAARIGRKLGSGAFGTVYLGIGLLEKAVAVKKLNLNGVNVVNVDDTITKQFRNEVEVLCKYKHENLLSLLGYSCDGPTYCLIYEYICGGALKDRLEYSFKWPDKFRLLWTDRLYIALGTAKAVSYLHNAYSMPLIHRDIKSANILLDGFNKPKLCDFGLIKLTPNANTNTSTSVFGTSAYMAPEAFRGDVSVKLDTFSFGVVLLELLTSLPPLDTNRDGNDLVTHVEDVCDNDIKPLLDINAGSWIVDNTNFADEIFDIAMECLEEKRHRPVMSVVVTKLSELIKKSVP